MLGLFGKQQQTVIGADVDSLSASLLELTQEGANFRLNAYERVALPQKEMSSDEASSDEDIDIEAQSACLAKLIKKGKFVSRSAISAVPASSVITKRLVMEASLSEDEMESQVVLEAEQVVPYPIDEVALDFEILGENTSDDEKVDVLLVACRKQTIDDKENILSLAGLQPQAVDVVTYAMERAYPLISAQLKLPAEHSVALVHIGDLFTTLNILKNGNIAYVRSFPFGVRQLADYFCQKTKCTLPEAFEYCSKQTTPSYEGDLMSEFFVKVSRQINRLLEQYYSAEHAPLVDHVFLSGGLPSMSMLQKVIGELVNARCTLANPFADMKLASAVNREQLNKIAPALFIACGLAMRGKS